MRRAAFLDRDGVINRKAPEGEYITRWEEMKILAGVPAAIAMLNHAGFHVIVVSNQRCVAKGLITSMELDSIHERLREGLVGCGARLDAIYYCPHEKQPVCTCRKPAPGMLLSAAADHEIDLGASWMIGDSEDDVIAGRAAGCRTALLDAGSAGERVRPDLVARSLLEAVHLITQPDGACAQADP